MLSLFLSVFSRDSLRAEIHNKEVQLQKEKEIIIARCDRHFFNCPLMFCFVLSFTLTYCRNRPMSSLNIVPLLSCTYSVKFIRAKLLLMSNLLAEFELDSKKKRTCQVVEEINSLLISRL